MSSDIASATRTVDSADCVFLARQPIFDTSKRVFAYELLYRDSAEAVACSDQGDRSSARLANALLTLGLGTLTGGHPAFCNLTERLLHTELEQLFPPELMVLELPHDLPATPEVLRACRRLREAGFALAADNFTDHSPAEAYLPFARYAKIDLTTTPRIEWPALAKGLRRRGVQPIALRVETAEAAVHARSLGFDLFQGFFFARPTTLRGRQMTPGRAATLDLLAALRDPDLTIAALERLVSRDVVLTYRVLSCVRSASMGLSGDVQSLRAALVLLGVDPVRTWASLWVLAEMNEYGHSEAVTLSLIRARCCEDLASLKWGAAHAPECFLLGLCSLLDVMLLLPMEQIAATLPIPHRVRAALCGEANEVHAILEAVRAYERGQWSAAQDAIRLVGLLPDVLARAYGNAIHWTHPLSHALAGA